MYVCVCVYVCICVCVEIFQSAFRVSLYQGVVCFIRREGEGGGKKGA